MASLILGAAVAPAWSVTPEELQGSWPGTQEDFALKRALVFEYVKKAGQGWTGDGRYGSTGYAKLDHLALVTLEGSPGKLTFRAQNFHLALSVRDADRMEGELLPASHRRSASCGRRLRSCSRRPSTSLR